MIFGIGVDQIDVRRVRYLIEKSGNKFENRCFTVNEILYSKRFSDPAKRLGARFAAKEAVMKSLGKGWREINWKDIEITGGGKPEVVLYGKAKEQAQKMNIFNIHISLSHEEDKAIAFAISELDK